MKNGFGVNGVDSDANAQASGASSSAPAVEPGTPLSALLHTLKAQANAALADDARVRREVEHARRVLTRTAEAAADALDRLAHAEEQLEYKWAQLAALLSEVKSLELERHEAMLLAQQLSAVEREATLPESEEDDTAHEVDLTAEASVLMSMENEAQVSSVSELRAALKHVVQAFPTTRLTR